MGYLKVLDTRYMIEDVVAELVPAINPEGKMRAGSCHRIPQSSSPSRFTAGTAGFLNFSQSGERPDRYRDPSRFETIPSSPILQACWKTGAR